MKKGKVAVIGLAGQSAFLTAEHFPIPGETVACSSLFFEPGGKGYNQAVACARMGIETVFIGAVGDDSNAEACRLGLEQEGIKVCFVKKQDPTAFAVITTVPDGENTVQVLGGASKCLTEADLKEKSILQELKECDYLLLQNELSWECLHAAMKLAKEQGIFVVLNPAPAEHISRDLFPECELLTPNYGEAKYLAGFSKEEEPSGRELAEAFRKYHAKKVVVTMGRKGAFIIDEEGERMIPAFSCGTTLDTTGAGDTFNGTLTAALAMDKSLEEAVRMAVVAAGISVTRRGAASSIPEKSEVMNHMEMRIIEQEWPASLRRK